MEVIFNMFRLKPLDELFPIAKEKNIGVIARVPLASGMLTGKYFRLHAAGVGRFQKDQYPISERMASITPAQRREKSFVTQGVSPLRTQRPNCSISNR